MQSTSVDQALASIRTSNADRVKDLLDECLRGQISKHSICPPHLQQQQDPHAKRKVQPNTIHCTFLSGFRHGESKQALECLVRMLRERIVSKPLPRELIASNRGEFKEMLLDCEGCNWPGLDGSIIWWLQWIPSASSASAARSDSPAKPQPDLIAGSTASSVKKKPRGPRKLHTEPSKEASSSSAHTETRNNKTSQNAIQASNKTPQGCACIISHAGRVVNWGTVRQIVATHIYRPEKCVYVPVMGGKALEQAAGVFEIGLVMHQFTVAEVDEWCVQAVQTTCTRIL